MATNQTLDVSLILKTAYPFSGIFGLNNTTTDGLVFDNTSVESKTVSVATGSPTVIVASAVSDITYVYVRNTDNTNIVVLKTDGAVAYADLSPGEFAFLPVKGSVGIEAQAAGSACIVEYATFKKYT
tara:strand:- start:1513 stop:1893 length:381 start_codon:yes stop_codon:yes gene_type:complete